MEPLVPSVFDEMEEQKPVYFASTGQRFANFAIDWVVNYLCAGLLGGILGLITRLSGVDMISFLIDETVYAKLWNLLFTYAVWVTYYTLSEGASKGRTLGKLITGTKAVRDDGGDITWENAFKRSICRLIPFEPFSALSGHPWHDTVSKTSVVKIR